MIKYTLNQISIYNKVFHSPEVISIISVVSEPETGKSFIAEEFLKTLNCESWVFDNITGESGLKKLYNQISQKFNYSFDDNLKFDFEMKKSVVSYLTQTEPKIIVLDNFEDYHFEVLAFWENIINAIQDGIKSKCLFIININSIDNFYESKLLRMNSAHVHPCNLPTWEHEDLKELFCHNYKSTMEIAEEDLSVIINC